MKKNVKLKIFLMNFRAIPMKIYNFVPSKETEQKAIEPRPQMMNGHERLNVIDNI